MKTGNRGRVYMRVSLAVFLIMFITLLTPVAASGARKKNKSMPVWERARHVFNTAGKIYRLGDWKKAADTLEQFIKKYPSNENIPVACLQLAHCRFNLKKETPALEALDVVIKHFPDSIACHFALGYKMSLAQKKKDYDGYLDLYEQMVDLFGRAPLNVSAQIDWRRVGSYYWRFSHTRRHWYYVRLSGYSLKIAPKLGWVKNLLQVADTPDRALRVLGIIDKTLKYYAHDLPVDWKFVHVELLRRAAKAGEDSGKPPKDTGKSKEKIAKTKKPKAKPARRKKAIKPPEAGDAQKQFQLYIQAWPKGDPRQMGLWLLEAERWQGKDDKKADKIFSQLIEMFPKYTSLGNRIQGRLTYLYKKKRHEDYAKLARWFLKCYPASRWRDRAISYWVTLARQSARKKKDTSHIPVVLKVIDEEEKTHYPLDPQRLKRNILWRIDLLSLQNKTPEVVKLAARLVGERFWSAESYSRVQALGKGNKTFAKILTDARKKHGIALADPKSKAAALFKELQGRIKDNQLRHMEEIGDRMCAEFRNDEYTVLAINALVDYYFKKVLNEKRDKWVELMRRAYPSHPLTQRVMTRQIKAIRGAKDFKRLGGLLDSTMKHFPGANLYSRWFNYRIECFTALKDHEGRNRYARRRLRKRAEAGELAAIALLGKIEEMSLKSWKLRGDYWRPLAEKFAGKYQGVYCLQRAFDNYYVRPVHAWHWNKVEFPSAAKVAAKLREQTIDPETQWKMMFEDINMMAQGNSGAAVLKMLFNRLKEKPLSFQLSQLLDMPNIGWSVGTAGLTGKAKKVLTQLGSRCKMRSDRYAMNVMLAEACQYSGKISLAVKYYLAAGPYFSRPIDRWALHSEAIRSLKAGPKSPRYTALQKKYIARIKTSQDVVPRLLLAAGRYNWPKALTRKTAAAFFKILRSRYSSSSQRGAAEKIMGN